MDRYLQELKRNFEADPNKGNMLRLAHYQSRFSRLLGFDKIAYLMGPQEYENDAVVEFIENQWIEDPSLDGPGNPGIEEEERHYATPYKIDPDLFEYFQQTPYANNIKNIWVVQVAQVWESGWKDYLLFSETPDEAYEKLINQWPAEVF